MNKLLLLATSLFCLNLQGYSSGIPQQGGDVANHNSQDSSIKDQKAADPKDAFKDLFESESSNSMMAFKLNPKAVTFVQDYWEEEGERLNKMKSWAKPFFDRIDDIFLKKNLPVERR